MKKKLLSLLLVAAMGVSMLVGCGGAADNSEGNGSENAGSENAGSENTGNGEFQVNQEAIDKLIDASKGTTISLELWCSETDAYQTVMKEVVAAFEAAYPDVDFDITIGAQSEANTKDRVLEDPEAAADVYVFAGDQIAELVKADALQPVASYYTYDVVNENGSGAVDAASINGQMYAYPFTSSNGYFLYYNTNYVTAEQAQSWEGLLEAAKACGGKVGMNLGDGWYAFGFFAGGGCNLSYDGTVNSCDWNSARGLKVAEAVMSIGTNANFISCSNTDATGMMATDPSSLIAYVDGTWDAEPVSAAMGDGYAATKLPTFNVDGEAVQMGSFAGHKLVGVSSFSENVGWAMLLAEWITNENNQTKIGLAVQECPANYVASQNEGFASNTALAALAAQSPYSQLQYVGDNYWTPAASLGAILAEGTTDLQKALDDAVAGITQP